jgi:DNA polymerase-3 subunit delta
MIIKSFEINKIKLNSSPFILLYGKNDGLKDQTITNLIKDENITQKYDEKEIIDNPNNFLESIFSESLFENKKIIIIKRVTDKIFKILSEIMTKKVNDLTILINADKLEKKSKLRSFFEKDKKYICIPFYPDNEQTLSKIALNFLKEKNISLSQSNINFIISKSNGDRKILISELEKIELYSRNGKKITSEVLSKITNLIENHSITELIDNCLIKNKYKTIKILSENNFNNEDTILIIRTFLNKCKRILELSYEFKKNRNINLTITSAKPPIFWKEKETTKQQILIWAPEEMKKIIFKLNNLELVVKKNFDNSLNLITDFILNLTSAKSSN